MTIENLNKSYISITCSKLLLKANVPKLESNTKNLMNLSMTPNIIENINSGLNLIMNNNNSRFNHEKIEKISIKSQAVIDYKKDEECNKHNSKTCRIQLQVTLDIDNHENNDANKSELPDFLNQNIKILNVNKIESRKKSF